ncbi:pentapeptide repeat-containing protein [Amycolatopsis sp. NPDC004378]
MAKRLLAATVTFALLAGAVWLLFFPVTELLAAREVAGMTDVNRAAALSTLRGQIGTLTGAAFVGGGLYYTGRKYFLDRDKQFTDRINTAVEHLGSAAETVRAGGIRALGRILQDSPRDRELVLRTVTGFLRKQAVRPEDDRDDILAALAVLRHRGKPARRADRDEIDLHGVCLAGQDLRGMPLADADLTEADFTGARLGGAILDRVNAGHTTFIGADLTGSALTGADLREARLVRAVLGDARLDGADLTGANLSGADLQSARGLTDGQLTGARTDDKTSLPEPRS